MSRQTSQDPIRVAWITAPNKSINDPIANGLGKDSRYSIGMFLSENARSLNLDRRHYKSFYFKEKDMTRLILGPLLLINKIRGLSNYDLTGTGLVSFVGLEDSLNTFHPDVVLINGEYNLFLFQAASWCRRNNVPYIIQTETQRIDSFYKRSIFTLVWRLHLHRVFSRAAAIWCWTKGSAEFYSRRISTKSIVVVLPGINEKLFRIQVKSPKRQPNRVTQFLVVARLVPFKNISTVLEACARLEKGRWHITIIGDGPERHRLQTIARLHGIVDSVTFIDAVPHAKLPSLYNSVDALILPSYNEAIGMVVPEAMACGTPVIVSDTVGARSYIAEGKTGYVFRTGSIEDLTRVLARFLQKDHRVMGRAASRVIHENHSSIQVIDEVSRVLNSVVHRGGLYKKSLRSPP